MVPAPGSCSASTSYVPLTPGLSTAMSKTLYSPVTADARVCTAGQPQHQGPDMYGLQSTPQRFYRCLQRHPSQIKQQAVASGCTFPISQNGEIEAQINKQVTGSHRARGGGVRARGQVP